MHVRAGDDGWVFPGCPNLERLVESSSGHLPEPLAQCPCPLEDSVLAFPDDSNQHNRFQDNLAVSPWIDLKAAGLVGAPGKILRTNMYAELPLRNYTFMQVTVQWYPEVCSRTGKLITSSLQSSGWVWATPSYGICTWSDTEDYNIFEFSNVIPPQAEQVRIAFGVLSYCRYFGDCTGVSNSSPWLDSVAFGVYGVPGTPIITALYGEGTPTDNFPENGTLNVAAPARVDAGGDTLSVGGGKGGAEVTIHFRAIPGPGVDAGRFSAWWNRHPESVVEPGFRMARMDTAERGSGGPIVGDWMACYHEEDPNFSGTDRDIDPIDIAPNGGRWRLANDIFRRLFTAGSRLTSSIPPTTSETRVLARSARSGPVLRDGSAAILDDAG
jgi:hypothetical protein